MEVLLSSIGKLLLSQWPNCGLRKLGVNLTSVDPLPSSLLLESRAEHFPDNLVLGAQVPLMGLVRLWHLAHTARRPGKNCIRKVYFPGWR